MYRKVSRRLAKRVGFASTILSIDFHLDLMHASCSSYLLKPGPLARVSYNSASLLNILVSVYRVCTTQVKYTNVGARLAARVMPTDNPCLYLTGSSILHSASINLISLKQHDRISIDSLTSIRERFVSCSVSPVHITKHRNLRGTMHERRHHCQRACRNMLDSILPTALVISMSMDLSVLIIFEAKGEVTIQRECLSQGLVQFLTLNYIVYQVNKQAQT